MKIEIRTTGTVQHKWKDVQIIIFDDERLDHVSTSEGVHIEIVSYRCGELSVLVTGKNVFADPDFSSGAIRLYPA